jgi:serine/threonine protein kinase
MEATSSNSIMLSPPKSTAIRLHLDDIKITASSSLLENWSTALGQLSDWRDGLVVHKELQIIASVVEQLFSTHTDNLYLEESDLLPRSLFINPTDETVYIFSKQHSTTNQGGNKKVCDAIKIQCLQNKPKRAFHFKRLSKKKKDRSFSEREINLEMRFSGIHELLSYPSKKGVLKTVLIQDAFDGDLKSLAPTLSSEERLDVFYLIVQKVEHIFEQGFVHGDIKNENVLIKREPKKAVKVKLADFEFAYNLKLPEYPKSSLLDNEYATKKYSAPEHFVKSIAKITDPSLQGQAEDLFALGILFLKLFSENEDPFESKGYAWSQEWYDTFVEETKEIIEPDLCKIVTIAKELLRPSPAERMTLPLLLTSIEELKTSISNS